MINVSSEFRQELANNRRHYQMTVYITLADETELTLTNEDIIYDGFSTDDAVSSDSAFQALGSCVINSATLTINNRDDTYSQYDFQNATALVYLQLLNERIKKGTYRVDKATYNSFSITLSMLDYMENFDRPYSTSSLVYPATLDEIVRDACSHCGVNLATSSLNFPHKSYVIEKAPTAESTTFRDAIKWASTIAGCFARCNVDGELELKWFDIDSLEAALDDETPTTFVPYLTSLYSQTVAVEDTVITGVKISVKSEIDSQSVITEYTEGQSGYMLTITDNVFITDDNAQTIVTWLGTQLIGLRFRQINITHTNDPTIEAGDVAVVIDRKNYRYPILVTRTSFKVSGKQTTICASETVSKNSAVQYSEATKNYVESRKQLKDVQTTFEERQDELEELIENAGGLYKTEVTEQGTTKIYYHNKPDLSESDIIMLFSDVGFTVSADGGDTWYGLTVDGRLISSILNTIGINADWINTGILSITKTEGGVTKEIFYANVDTGVVRIVADEFSLTSGATIESIANGAAAIAVQSANSYTDTQLGYYAEEVDAIVENLQEQIDGQIETWYYDAEPTLNNLPASSWETEDDKSAHEGDIYYWKSKGYAYRFMKINSVWQWVLIQDTDVALAIGKADAAQTTANAKRRVFVDTPYPPYDVGDLWFGGAESNIMMCTTAKSSSGSYSADDWEKSEKYTDDTLAQAAIDYGDTLSDALDEYQDSNDAALEDLRQSTTDADKAMEDALSDVAAEFRTDVGFLKTDVGELKSWITITYEEIGGIITPVMRLGASDSDIYAILTNDKLEFRMKGNENAVAYIAADANGVGKLYATNSVVVNEMQFGKWAFYQRANENMSVKWIG